LNNLLVKHRPSDTTIEKWEEHWENQRYTLEPLAKALIDMKKELGKVRRDDFDIPNHYAKLVSELSQVEMIDRILALLPASVEKN
jgi:hypothetical protein